MVIRGTTQKLGVIGYPVAHSQSPLMHNAVLNHLDLDYVYVPLEVAPPNLGVALTGLAALGWRGFNVTLPHKQAVMPLLEGVTPLAQQVGAVNTVWWEKGWQGTNTDVRGFLAPLLERQWSGHQVLVLGCGGSARAVVSACAQLGCGQIAIVGRDPHKLHHFCSGWAVQGVELSARVWSELPSLLPATDLLVNTTPLGMHPQVNESPVSGLELMQLPRDAIVYDLVYNPRPSLLLQESQAQGLGTIDGLEMLIYQGAAALEIWLEQSVPVDVMRSALLHASPGKIFAGP